MEFIIIDKIKICINYLGEVNGERICYALFHYGIIYI